MGAVKKVLAETKVEELPSNYVGIELCETVHLHLPGFRWELTIPQFTELYCIFRVAYEKWKRLGRPEAEEKKFIVLGDGDMPGQPVYNSRFIVEEQTIPQIHVHHRSLNLRFSKPEYQKFVETLTEAYVNLEKL